MLVLLELSTWFWDWWFSKLSSLERRITTPKMVIQAPPPQLFSMDMNNLKIKNKRVILLV